MPFVVAKESKDKNGIVLSRMFYAGYAVLENRATEGLMWSNDPKQAYAFETQMGADNWLGGERGGDRAGDAVVLDRDRL